MASDELEALRREVMRRRKAATDKISRTRRTKGIELGNTEYDPRRPTASVKRYNAKQLRTYLRALNSFNSRQTGFLSGAKGAVIPKITYNQYKVIERQYNAYVANRYKRVAKIKLPTGLTVEERDATIRPRKSRRAYTEAINRTLEPQNIEPSMIANVKALKIMSDRLMDKMSGAEIPKRIRAGREQAEQMLKAAGATDEIKNIRNLTDNQFYILWEVSGFPDSLSTLYENVQRANISSPREVRDSSIVATQQGHIRDFLGWARTLPAEG